MNSSDKNSILQETHCLSGDDLLRYRDNKMSAEERHRAERHLVDCALCSEALEGVAFVTSPLIFEKVREDVRSLSQGGQQTVSVSRKYWLAAASVAAIAVMAAYMMNEYKDVQHPAVAMQKEPVTLPGAQEQQVYISNQAAPVKETPQLRQNAKVVPAVTSKLNTESAKEIAAPAEEISADPVSDAVSTGGATSQPENTVAADESLSGNSYPATYSTSNQVSYPKLVTPTVTSKRAKSAAPAADVSRSETSNLKDAEGNPVTYVQNLKVIDYRIDDQKTGTDLLEREKSVESKFENRQKKEASAASQTEPVRKTTYLELIADPIRHYKQGEYAAAVNGFNEILAIHPDDQNALFYKGMSLYHLERHQEAIASLSGPANETRGTFSEESKYYMAMSYIAIGNTAIAKDLLHAIVENNGFYADRALKELKKLE